MLDLVLTDSRSSEFSSRLNYLEYSSALNPVVFNPKISGNFKQLNKIPTSETLVLGSSTDEKVIRKLLEDPRVDGVVNLETSTGRDHTHYRRSNINQVIAKIARDKGKIYFIDFSRILQTPVERRYILLGRIMQNIKIMQKYQVPISIASFAKDKFGLRNQNALVAVAKVLGVRKVTPVESILKNKQDRLSGKIVSKGIKVLD